MKYMQTRLGHKQEFACMFSHLIMLPDTSNTHLALSRELGFSVVNKLNKGSSAMMLQGIYANLEQL